MNRAGEGSKEKTKGQNGMTREKIIRSLLLCNGVVIFLAAGYLLVFVPFLSKIPLFKSVCLVHEILHVYCPACGGTRALQYLLSFRIADSLMAHPVVFLGALALLYYDVLMVLSLIVGRGFYYSERVRKISRVTVMTVLISVAVVFALVRDILLVSGPYDYFGELIGFWR